MSTPIDAQARPCEARRVDPQVIAAWLTALRPLLELLLFALVAFVAARVEQRSKSAETRGLLDALTRAAGQAVAATAQTLVAEAKDPARPGLWDDRAKQAARDLAAHKIRQLVPGVDAALRAAGIDPVAALGTAIEAAVLRLGHVAAALPSPAPAPAAPRPSAAPAPNGTAP